MKQTTKDLAGILSERNTEGKYNAIIERAANNGYHDHKFEKVPGHPEYGDCNCPKVQLVTDLAPFPELEDIRQLVMDGKFDEPADEEDIAEMREWLLKDNASNTMFETMGFKIPTKEEREKHKPKSQKNIVSGPDDKMNDIKLNVNIGGKDIEFKFQANIRQDEVYPVVDNWAIRTKDYTVESLVAYINSKSQYGFKAKLK